MTRAPHVVIEDLRCEAPDGRVTLDIPRLTIGAGERVAIVGPNGAGKSTLLRCLSGFATPVAGRVQVLDRLIGVRMAGPELRRLRGEVAQVLQGLHLVQRLTVLENVLVGALGRLHGWRSWARWHRPQDVAEALRAIEAVGLTAKADERTDRLSGGERQKVSIARMLMQRPRLILADEPTASLDPAAAREVCRLLQGGAAHATLITVVHHPELLPLLADRVIGLRHGRLVFDQPLARLDPAMLDALYGADTDSTEQDSSPTPATGWSFRPYAMTAVLPGLLQ
jgi:phosphonate transport system ATP-binding protein